MVVQMTKYFEIIACISGTFWALGRLPVFQTFFFFFLRKGIFFLLFKKDLFQCLLFYELENLNFSNYIKSVMMLCSTAIEKNLGRLLFHNPCITVGQ